MPPKFGGTELGARHELVIAFESVRSLLDKYAKRDAAKTALYDLDQDESINFGELNEIANRVGSWLTERGIGKGDRVALLSEECLEKLIPELLASLRFADGQDVPFPLLFPELVGPFRIGHAF